MMGVNVAEIGGVLLWRFRGVPQLSLNPQANTEQ